MSTDSSRVEGLQQHTPERTASPLFEPEGPVPAVIMVAPLSPKPSTPEVHSLSPHIRKLREIERNAKLAILSWNTSGVELVIPSKRKVPEMLSDSDDEDSDDEKDQSQMPAYDPIQHCRPKLPIYHPGFKQAEEDAQAILRVFMEFWKAAKNRGVASEDITYLWNETIKYRDISYQGETRIAVTGDSGSGKSALINSFLGEELVPEGDAGEAVTNVVTEFRKKPLSMNTGAVQAEVQFYCLEYCIDNLVTNWFTIWFTTRQKLIDDEDSVDDKDRTLQDAALQCLNQLFASRVAPESLEGFMSTGKTLEDNSALKQLVQWTVEIHQQFVPDGDLTVPLTSSTHNDMREQLRGFRMRDVTNARYKGKILRFSTWPFVEIIRYYYDSPLLLDGICFGDVAGSKDINIFRVTAAKAYLQQCEMTIAVAEIKRATTDGGFQEHYLEAHRRRHHGSVILVVTRTDDLNEEGTSTLQLDDTAEEKIAPIEEKLNDYSNELDIMENQTETNKLEIKRIKLKMNHGTATDGERTRYDTLRAANKIALARKKAVNLLKESLEKERTDARVACRNRTVAAKLSDQYSHSTGDDAGAPVFCVSNKMYMRYRRGYNSTKAPTMRLEDTQIPAACAHVVGIPSQGKTAVLEHFLHFKVPMLLSIVQMSCSKSTEARVEHVTKIIDKAIKDIATSVRAVAKRCIQTFLKELIAAISSQDLQKKFDRNARKKLEDLTKMAAASYRALLNKKGAYHQKKLNVHHDFNAALLEPVKSAIDVAFRNALDKAPMAFKAQAAQTIKTGLSDLNKRLKDDPQALAGKAYQSCFANRLIDHEKNITLNVETARKQLRQGLNTIGQKALSSEDQGYIYKAMESIYPEAFAQTAGKGQVLRRVRHAYLEAHVTSLEGPFSAIAEWVEEDATKLIEKTCDKLCEEIVKTLREIRTAFHKQKYKKENNTPEGQRFLKELHELVDEARRIFEGPVNECLKKCKEHK